MSILYTAVSNFRNRKKSIFSLGLALQEEHFLSLQLFLRRVILAIQDETDGRTVVYYTCPGHELH